MRRSESEAAVPPHMQKPSTIDIDPVIYLAIELSASTWLVVIARPVFVRLMRRLRRRGRTAAQARRKGLGEEKVKAAIFWQTCRLCLTSKVLGG